MAKQKRTPANSKPITSNPLFPAVVALWFGALFGLGSLAVRASLIEELVLSSRIDLIVPAAAPPLGVTARIMLALILATLGAMIGLVFARRLARPRIEFKERNRGARGLAESAPKIRARDAHPDAPSCTPVSIRDLDPALPSAPDNLIAGRRRALTVDHGEDHFVPHEFAPLPGGEPQILDMAGLAAMPAPAAHVADTAPALHGFDRSAQLAPVTLPAALPVAEPARQVFQPEAAAPVTAAVAALAPESAAAHADGRQVFGMTQPAPQPERPRQIFGMAVADDHVPQNFVRDAGYGTTVFDTELPQPLFERESALAAPPQLANVVIPAPQHFEALAPGAALVADAPVLATQQPLPSPADLGLTDLATRLAESMRRRRAARSAAAAGMAEAVIPQAMPQTAPVAQTDAPVTEPMLAVPEPQGFAAPMARDLAVHQIGAAPQVPQDFVAAVASAAILAPVEAAQIDELPNALRPLALDAFLEEDVEFESTLLPPRRIAFAPTTPAQVPIAAAVPVAAAPIPAAYEPAPIGIEEVAEEAEAEENYASLLGIAQPRAGFVRIDQPEADGAAPEPVVIFPGQMPLGQPPAGIAPAEQPLADGSAFRRFDSPAAAGHGQPVEMVSAAPAVAAIEADQALRTALASLQRISGAA
ncbi:hypothetical protein [Novosphingobium sp.]|uniref:hypothetical protein n=1 Tax=Novosphingobium sp. TaxID=1874826 RepID=UPI00286A42F1|nr:hypothetical protein [Novosphingobium sp.]